MFHLQCRAWYASVAKVLHHVAPSRRCQRASSYLGIARRTPRMLSRGRPYLESMSRGSCGARHIWPSSSLITSYTYLRYSAELAKLLALRNHGICWIEEATGRAGGVDWVNGVVDLILDEDIVWFVGEGYCQERLTR